MKKMTGLLALLTLTLTGTIWAEEEPNHVMRKVNELGHAEFHGIVKKSGKMWDAATDLKTPYIVLVPNDTEMKKAMVKIMSAAKDKKQGIEDVKDALMQHVVIADKGTIDHDIMAGELDTALSEGVNTMGGGTITVNGKKVLLDDEEAATIVNGPHKTENGYVYTISTVLPAS